MDLSSFQSDNSSNKLIISKVPKITKKEKCVLGIDEAGRGPVLGPMVYAVAYCPISCLQKLEELKFADSKTLTEENRERLFRIIDENNDFIGWMLEIISPNTISNSMLKRCKYNLNESSHDSAIGLIKQVIKAGINADEVYLDTVGIAEKYQSKLSEIFPDLKITVAKQADSTYPIVSAASICAKVARDRVIGSWNFRENWDEDFEYGSGYPNDPATKKFLTESLDPIFGYPQLVRFSWSTANKILQEKAVEVEWSDEEECDSTPSIRKFFGKRKSSPKKCKDHSFFKDRHLSQVQNL
ncbi:ribonuclease H2 subunit A-like isoform X1 [Centruroides sculpturatus]|uniref:ribonuclease H2 subunit A-like isoform X1 n=2 Tax=Centruroides sculpturatus TaxID=218467 RepID=UPI000C6EFFCF|nr:ribonuclease H2 subunit A-like isoform X1 [Centruroides sculpturatus]